MRREDGLGWVPIYLVSFGEMGSIFQRVRKVAEEREAEIRVMMGHVCFQTEIEEGFDVGVRGEG